MAKSTVSCTSGKPDKPRPDFPLFPHDNGRWAKKVKGKLCYFGKWDDDSQGERALRLWSDQKDDLLAGKPQPQMTHKGTVGLPLHKLVNDYLNAKRRLLDAGEIAARTFGEYHSTALRVVQAFGRSRQVANLTASDFGKLREQLAKTRGPVALGNEVTRVKMIFTFGYDEGLIEHPMRYGQSFNKPSAKVIRKVRAASGSRMFEADELRRILDALDGKPVEVDGKDGPLTLSPNPVLRAMTLLAINCAYGQWDVASLPRAAVDLKGGWSTFPRPKTGIPRRAKLWPETVAALQSVMTCRPAPRDEADADLVFLTAKGKRWVRASGGDNPARWKFRTDLIGNDFGKMLDSLGINGRRGFYAIRHSFQTVAEDSRDMPAIKLVMGHADSSMSGIYRERVSDERLEAVAGVVRAWLWPDATKLTDA